MQATNTVSSENNENHILSFGEKVSYGLGDFATNLTWSAIGSFIVFYYTDTIGLAAAAIGTIMLISKSLDGIWDLIMGAAVDKTHTKYGKARPWLLWAAPAFALLSITLFTVPNIGYTGKLIYVFISYNLLSIAFSAVVIPYGTLNTLITRNRDERDKANLFRMFFGQGSGLFVSNAVLPLVAFFGGHEHGWIMTFIVFSIIGMLMFLWVFRSQRERVHLTSKVSDDKVSFSVKAKAMFTNKYWIIVVLFFIVFNIASSLQVGALVYYAKYIFNDSTLVGALTAANVIPLLICLLFTSKIFEKIGKRNAMLIGAILNILGYLINAFSPYNFILTIIGQIIKGIGMAAMVGGIFALLPDTIEYGYMKTKIRIEGLLYAGGSFGQKVGAGIGTALLGWILSYFGYLGGAAHISAHAITGIQVSFIWAPIVLFIIQAILLWMYKLDNEFKEKNIGNNFQKAN
ncbi:MFS transporter [Levilactobacillus namurensis]|uniref:MFS transporter n=1 Tax=Levilactobacillus namurensis TaxID=380393 RepID=A0AAW8W433_9LACO|nr:MFS transporter [Levilactobacillus namurensis]MDT7013181.1 MFS transporter [Levilactobacillus namurensis]HJE44175.1 MFS transporter [Levilactobacillus namurensis]